MIPSGSQTSVTELRCAIDSLSGRTRQAMLQGVGYDTVITGAYTDNNGGVCPMLSAHRQGARANFVAFAGAWDRFTGVEGLCVARRATPREIDALVVQLQESLSAEGPESDLSAAIAEHRALATRASRRRALPVLESDFATVIAEHQALARARRGREATRVGLDWLHGGDVAPEPTPTDRPTPSRRRVAAMA